MQSGARNMVDNNSGPVSYGTGDLSQQDLTGQAHQHPSNSYEFDSQQTQKSSRRGPPTDIARLSQNNLPIRQEKKGGSLNQDNTRDNAARDRSRQEGDGGKSSSQRVCLKCNQPLTGQFVRAIGGTFHLECFKCRDCGQVVASKFFPVDDEGGEGQYPLCETDYFRRLDLLCFACGGALRGSYVTALDRKFHIDHFTCSVCPTAFGAKDNYYEHEGKVYCHYHYSTRFAQRCNGCQTAILKQFVEIFRNGQNQHWHPECYMIHKFWNVRLSRSGSNAPEPRASEDDTSQERRDEIREEEEQMEERTYRIWSVLSTFEETSAACISDMLLHVSNGAYMEGVLVAKKFILYVDILFGATDRLDANVIAHGSNGLSYGREAKLLCKRIVSFFTLLTKTQDTGVKRLGVTQELLSLVTGLAHYLKLLIRISLQGALKLERETRSNDGLRQFLDDLTQLDSIKETTLTSDETQSNKDLAEEQSDLCAGCQQPIDDECLKAGAQRWHCKHLQCDNCRRNLGEEPGLEPGVWMEQERKGYCLQCLGSQGRAAGYDLPVENVSRLQQYVYLLRVALARLLSVLRSSGTLPHTSDDPNLSTFDSNEGHRLTSSGHIEPPLLSPETRSKSFGGSSMNDQPQSSYEETVGEMKRLRSTRMEKHLSTNMKKARTSRIIDGPEAQNITAGIDAAGRKKEAFHIVEDKDTNGETRTELAFGHQDALTLDDIPRIVAAEQAKEQRPNAYRHAQNKLISGGRQPKLLGGHQRDVMGNHDAMSHGNHPVERTKRYFSELSGLEYFIVRHVAVLQMQPLLEGLFNLEDLLSLIELRKQNFWNKFFNKKDNSKGGKKKGVFGVNLDTLVEMEGVESTYGVGPGALRVPALIDDAITAMRQMDMSVEGVFRKNGNIRGLKELADRLDAKKVDVDLSKESPVQVAALLKKFLREMPDPLLTHKLHDLFTTSQKITDEAKRKRLLHLTCCLLPKAHRDCLEILFAFLNWAASFSQVDEETGSKMDSHNLATVIAPNILYADAKMGQMDESFLAIEAVHMLLDYNDQMCEVPEDIQSVLSDTELFNNMPEVTTKEILKRYGEVAKSPDRHFGNTKPEIADAPIRSSDSNGSRTKAPKATRIDTDPNQAHAWQKESSVRHIQQNGAPSYPSTNHNTLLQPQAEFPNRPSPYHFRTGSSGSVQSEGTPSRYSQRPPNWGKQNANGAVGTAGGG